MLKGMWLPQRPSEETHNDPGRPGVQEEDGTHEKRACKHHADGQEKPVAEAEVLLPEEEGVAVGVAGQPQARVVVADGPDLLDGLHEVGGVPQAVEVERELSVLNGLRGGDCRETGTRGRATG